MISPDERHSLAKLALTRVPIEVPCKAGTKW